ncbi:MAG: radical SAM protein [Clostridiales bacterium]
MKINNVYGTKKFIFNLYLKIRVFFTYFPKIFTGQIDLKGFIIFIKRLLVFIKILQHNKFVSINKETKIDLYVPGFPTKAFLTACNKFLVFNEKLPCTVALISITSKCRFNCQHCYQRFDRGRDVNIKKLVETVRILQDKGVAFFNIEGGEPFLEYGRLVKLCEAIDSRSEIWVNSTGDGITRDRLIELRKNNVKGIIFSLHNPDKNRFNEFMGNSEAFNIMEKGINLCHKENMVVAFNSCLLKDDFYNGNFEKIMSLSKSYNSSILQIIKPKPSGAWLNNDDLMFSNKDIKNAKTKINMYNSNKEYSDYPSISAQIIEESKEVFGCTAGGTDRLYINAKGDLQPCEFLNISFGNIEKDDFNIIYNKMRLVFENPCECMICEKYSKSINTIYKKNKLNSLPVTPELSKEIYKNWDRENETKLYKKLK